MRFLLLCLSLAGTMAGQAIVERAVTTGAAASASGGIKATGSAIGKTLGRASGALAGAAEASGSTASPASQAVIAPVVKEKDAPPAKVPAAEEVKTGMTREELLKSFGEPASKMSMAEDGKLVERFRYSDKISYVRVILEDGKVKEVTSGKNQ